MTRRNYSRTTKHSALLALTTIAIAIALGGCRGDDPPGESDSATSTSTSSGSESASSTSGPAETTTTTGSTGSTTEASAGFITTQGSSTGAMPQPNGSQCESDAGCVSMNCYEIPMAGGVCSECKSDADCIDAGTGISCSLDAISMQAKCTDGGLGTTCETQESCAEGLICDEVIAGTFGLIPTACGECGESSDCDSGQLCSPKVDFMMLSGYKACVDPGSVQNDELCPTNDEGDLVCKSGKCGDVLVMGIIKLGVCGDCLSDDDCMDGTCTPGSFDGGIKGSVCN